MQDIWCEHKKILTRLCIQCDWIVEKLSWREGTVHSYQLDSKLLQTVVCRCFSSVLTFQFPQEWNSCFCLMVRLWTLNLTYIMYCLYQLSEAHEGTRVRLSWYIIRLWDKYNLIKNCSTQELNLSFFFINSLFNMVH